MEEKTNLDKKKRGKTKRWSLNYDKINNFKEKELNNRRLGALIGMNPYSDTFKMEEKTSLDKKRECDVDYRKSSAIYYEEDVQFHIQECLKKIKIKLRSKAEYVSDELPIMIDEALAEVCVNDSFNEEFGKLAEQEGK